MHAKIVQSFKAYLSYIHRSQNYAGGKMKFHLSIIPTIIIGLMILLYSPVNAQTEKKSDRETEILEIELAINNSIGWAKNKNLDLLYSIIANDSNFVEVHPDKSVVKGFEQFKRMEPFWMSPDFKAVRYEIKNLKITLSQSGDAAWFFCMLDDINEWKGQPANWENTRWTGVLEKREGKWRMVQQHFSFASQE